MNKTICTMKGNLTSDPQVSYTQNGDPVCTFTIAVNRSRKVGDDWENELEGFYDFVSFGKKALNIAAALTKGDQVVAFGHPKQRKWEDREGNQRVSIQFETDEIGLSVNSKRFVNGEVTQPGQPTSVPHDDVPF